MNGKGDKPRPTNLKKYRKNFDIAFNKAKRVAKVKDSIDVSINQDTGAIELKSNSGVTHRERKIKVIKEYTDQNGIDMVIVNIDDSLTNKTMTKNQLKTLQHELVNEETVTTPVEDSNEK
jgi:predicted HAD superfamily phosphohydrolase